MKHDRREAFQYADYEQWRRRHVQRHQRIEAAMYLLAAIGLAVLSLAFAGCAAMFRQDKPTVVVPGEDVAIRIIWRDVYGRKETPPEVRWETNLTCGAPRGHPGFMSTTPRGEQCVAGSTLLPNVVTVAYVPGEAISNTSLSHELWHSALAYQMAIDTDHVTEGWAGMPACGEARPYEGIVQRANAVLKENGL